jgi:hypothetical protein
MGFVLILLFVFYILTCVWIYGYVCKKTKSKKIRVITIVLLVLIGFGDNIVQLTTFYYLCHTQGGQKIYRTVENVEGYLKLSGQYGYIEEDTDLIEGKYKFIEVEVKRDMDEEKQSVDRGEQPIRLSNGRYRYYLAKADSPRCEFFYKRKKYYHPDVIKTTPYYKFFPKGYCMAIEKVDAFKSQYAYGFSVDESLYPILRIRKATTKVWDIRTGEILGSMTSFIYYGSWLSYCMYGFAITECPKDDYTRLHSSLLYKVLKPNKNMEVMK